MEYQITSMMVGVLVAALLGTPVQSANILVLLPYPAPSHFYSFYPLVEELKNRDHNITIVSPFRVADEKINEVSLAGVHKLFPASFASLRQYNRFLMMLKLHGIVDTFVQGSLIHPNFQHLIRSNGTQFDLVMMELYYNDAYLALAKKFNAPVVALVSQALQTNHGWRLSTPISFSYIPNMYLPVYDHMSFVQRTLNTVFSIVQILVYECKFMAEHQKTVNREFNFLDHDQRNVYSMSKDIALTLINTHHSFAYPRPFQPNIVEVGGIHLKKPKPLPKDLQTFMDEAPKDGVVYISFGTMVDPSIVDTWTKAIVEVFGNLPVRVMWKWKPTLLKKIPTNFLIQEWFPQNDILNHPRCRIFLTHGGIHSIIESVNAAVPMLGHPLFSEQPYNVATIEKLGIGIALDDIQTNTLESAVHKILNDPSYQENMNYRSKLFRTRLTDPVTTAAYWVEHVLEHKGAAHLKSAAEELSWYQYLLLDVYAFLLVLLVICTYTFIYVLRLALASIKRSTKFLLNKLMLYLKSENKAKTT